MANQERIKQYLDELTEYGDMLVWQSMHADPCFDNIAFFTQMGRDIITFAKKLGERKITRDAYHELINEEPIKNYLNLAFLIDQTKPKNNQPAAERMYDLCVSILRGFFRIFDLLYSYLSGSEKTAAQRAEEKVLQKHSFLNSDTTELKEEMRKSAYINYSLSGQFFNLAKKTHINEITGLHAELEDGLKEVEKLFNDLDVPETLSAAL